MNRNICSAAWMAAFLVVTGALSQADTLVDFPSDATWVSVNQNLQGRVGNPSSVPFSMTNERSPTGGYTGPIFYGGATATVSVTTWLLANSTPDYLLLGSGAAIVGDRGVMVIMFTNTLSTITNIVMGNRPTGNILGQTNWLRVVVQRDDQFYISEENYRGAGLTELSLDRAALEAMAWFEYDPTNSLMDAGALAPGFLVTNIQAVGVYRGQEITDVSQTQIAGGLYSILVSGDPSGSSPSPSPSEPELVFAQGTGSSGVEFVVSWTSTVGRIYAVESTTNLAVESSWQGVVGASNLTGTGNWLSYTGSAAETRQNWRVMSADP